MTSDMTFGEKLRDLRRSLKKSQTEVADEIAMEFPDRIRISQTTLSSLEQRNDPPRDETVEVLAEYFGVPTSYFDSQETQRTESALAYLNALRKGDSSKTEGFAHSSDLRHGHDDEVGRSIRNLRIQQDNYDEDEFFDT